MALGEIIDASITLYRNNWQVLAGIVAVFVVPLSIVGAMLNEQGGGGQAAAFLLSVLIGPLMGGAISRAAGELYLGRKPEVGSAISFTMSRIAPLLIVTVLTTLAVILGLVALIIPGFILMVRLYFSSIIVVLENRDGTDAMRRSFDLTKGHSWRLVGAALVIAIITAVVSGILQIPILFLTSNLVAVTAISALIQVLVTPFSAVAAVLLYFDLRVRKEAFDLELLAAHLQGPRDAGTTSW